MNLLKYILYGPKPDLKAMDKLAKARPRHQTFSELAKSLSGWLNK